ncbi:autoinducer 2-degrading protein LsrG [Clostridium acetireducens DSM 10703]|uniref:Autoinducer 2-degrading protein LsrG n=1 Tax=Clostridium acetireducens DSM 10703 TaxID=1121290 RepID=A0A1E8EYG5_9CLOT|nr:putative quinol monooxygenase [Clostridium acetireducens]OFI06017.1 autoinducer 2-degrading protein LsrG [Clostridium acetireducens DSM 10703]
MIKVVAKKFVKQDKLDEVIKLYEELVEASRKEEGCIKYELFQDDKDSTILAVIEEWESKDALAKHNNAEHFKRIVPMIAKLVLPESTVNVYNKLI